MAMTRVSTQKLKDEANALKNVKNQLQNEITAMRSYSARYLSMWDGEAKKAFTDSVTKNMNLLNLFVNNMDKFINALNNISADYEQAENKAKSIAASKGQG